MSGSNSESAFMKASLVSTRFGLKFMPALRSSRSTSSASAATSSTISMRALPLMSLRILLLWVSAYGNRVQWPSRLSQACSARLLRRLIQYQPEQSELRNRPHKVFKFHRLDYITIYAKIVTLREIPVFPRRGHYYHG